ncbi:MAG: AAA family ATPase [Microcoleaceae cyanobacterium]
MQKELGILIEARYPLIYIITSEEARCEQLIARVAQEKRQREVYVWTLTRGFVEQSRGSAQSGTVSPQAAIEWTIRQRESKHREPGSGGGSIYVFKDLHPFRDSPEVTRCLRDAVANFRGSDKTIVLLSPVQEVPIELEKEVVVLDFPLPDMGELDEVLSAQLEQTRSRRISLEAREKLLKGALGLTHDEAEKVYRKAYVTNGCLSEGELDIVLSEKRQLIRRNRILEYMDVESTMQSVGGADELKEWLSKRANVFSEEARQYGLPTPKGILILGVPGCGKSLIAKATSRLWGLPMLRLDMGRVYDGSTVGRSEANLRNAIKTAESVSPAILFIDELDKAFAGGAGSADSDAGTSSRIFGSFLTWMQDKTSPVFVVATANRVDRLPSEFLRKGRFDEIFFVDLPTVEERQEIFRIHLTKRRPDVQDRFDIKQLASEEVSGGLSGAEVEQAIIAAMHEAFAHDKREFTQLDIIAALKATRPLSTTMSEQIEALRNWARVRARPATTSFATYMQMES